MTEEKIEFLYSSINDMQETIRTIDNKIIGFLFISVLPVTILKEISDIFKEIVEWNICIGVLLVVIVGIFWCFGIYNSFRCIISIDNPSNLIKGKKGMGYFYGVNLFQIDRCNKIEAKKTFEVYKGEIKGDWEVIDELIFEQMKLVSIRDLKLRRQKIALISILIVLSLSVLSWVLIYITKNT